MKDAAVPRRTTKTTATMLTMPRLLLFAARRPLLARANASSTSIQEVASIALAHGIEMPIGTAPIFAGAGRGLGLGAPTSPSPSPSPAAS